MTTDLVDPSIRCAGCERAPRKGERFGTEEKDWDRRACLCPECWDLWTKEMTINPPAKSETSSPDPYDDKDWTEPKERN